MNVFHSGERKVQSKLGVTETANLVGRMIQPYMEKTFHFFVELQPMAIVSSTDANGL